MVTHYLKYIFNLSKKMKHMQIQRARVGRRGSFVDIFLFVWIAKDLRGWQKDQCVNIMSFKIILFLIKKNYIYG